MFGTATPYIVSVLMMLFAGASALVLITFVRSLDPPDHPDVIVTKNAA